MLVAIELIVDATIVSSGTAVDIVVASVDIVADRIMVGTDDEILLEDDVVRKRSFIGDIISHMSNKTGLLKIRRHKIQQQTVMKK